MTRRIALGSVLLLVGATLLFLQGGAAISALTNDPTNDPLQPVAGPAMEGPAVPTITANDRDVALGVLKANVVAAKLLNNRQWTLEKSGPWTTTDQKLIGVALLVRFSSAASFAQIAWPSMQYDRTEASSPPYRTMTFNAAANNVEALEVLVDLANHRVVSITPLGEAIRLTPAPTEVASAPSGY